MKITLHIGSHRTGTTTFQSFVRHAREELRQQGVVFWGPHITRNGLFAGVQPQVGLGRKAARQAPGRIALRVERTRYEQGAHRLLLSDENMLGTMGYNLRRSNLYPDAGERMARIVHAFAGRIDTIALAVRSLDQYWSSLLAYQVARGHSVPQTKQLDRIAWEARSWRDVITDIACAAPDIRLLVTPFERFAGRPDAALAAMAGAEATPEREQTWLNRRPDQRALRRCLQDRGSPDTGLQVDNSGRWIPFSPAAREALQENYADDMHWLVAGADGLAQLTEDMDRNRAGTTPPFGPLKRGQGDDNKERHLAHTGGG